MREILWAAAIVVAGTVWLVLWKADGPPVDGPPSAVRESPAVQNESEGVSSTALSPPSKREVASRDLLNLHTTQAGIDLIKRYEGLRLEAYQGPGGKWLIGYGHSQGVRPGMTITEAQAEDFLRSDLVAFENGIKSRLRVPVTERELSAMVSLAYSIGGGAFVGSSVLRELNAGNREAAADAFLLWNKVRSNGDLVESAHLTNRRREEREMFLSR